MILWTCEHCSNQLYVEDEKAFVICTCRPTDRRPPPLMRERIAICNGCQYRVQQGCALYLKPCSIARLWADQIDPPEKCPHKAQMLG